MGRGFFLNVKRRPKKFLVIFLLLLYTFAVYAILRYAYEKEISDSNKKEIEKGKLVKLHKISKWQQPEVIVVLVLVCDRMTITRTLDQLLKYRPNALRFPIIVSQDCGLQGKKVKQKISATYGRSMAYITHPHYLATKKKIEGMGVPGHMRGYYHISTHYGWALNYTFYTLGYENVIIVEDDLDIAPDFYEFFESTLPILKSDRTLWCVSAYNDNGRLSVIDESKVDLLFRTDFFPGLGWMLSKSVWRELSSKWPSAFWDDWMRDSKQRKNRACIHPEVSRTKTYGRKGVSNGQFFDKFLARNVLDKVYVQWNGKDLSYLRKAAYDKEFMQRINLAKFATLAELKNTPVLSDADNSKDEYKLSYKNQDDFASIATKFGIMDDFKDGVPRNGYMGIVPVMSNGKRVYLVPANKFQ